MTADLPDYENPPVIEVAMGAQYRPLTSLRAAHVGLYWAQVKEEFPEIDEKPPLPHAAQDLDSPIAPRQLRLGLSDRPELPRSWFVSACGSNLMQLQRDRFVLNWRRVADDAAYPRYPTVRERFRRHWGKFTRFLASNNLGPPRLDLLELTYVNIIPQGQGWKDMKTVGDVFLPAAWTTRSGFLPVPDSLRSSLSFLLPERKGQLSVDMGPVASEGKPISLRVSLSVTGLPEGVEDDRAMDEWFDLAREWIVRGFVDLMSPATDKLWGRKA